MCSPVLRRGRSGRLLTLLAVHVYTRQAPWIQSQRATQSAEKQQLRYARSMGDVLRIHWIYLRVHPRQRCRCTGAVEQNSARTSCSLIDTVRRHIVHVHNAVKRSYAPLSCGVVEH